MLIFVSRIIIGLAILKYDDDPIMRDQPDLIYGFQEGAELDDIENLPEVKLQNQNKLLVLKEICAICASEYEENDIIKTLPCNHDYHKDCAER